MDEDFTDDSLNENDDGYDGYDGLESLYELKVFYLCENYLKIYFIFRSNEDSFYDTDGYYYVSNKRKKSVGTCCFVPYAGIVESFIHCFFVKN